MRTRFALKAATEDIHHQLDDAMSRFDLADAADYARFLGIHARAVPPIEEALDNAGISALVDGWKPARAGAIEADLASLGKAMPPPAAAPIVNSVGQMLGTAYVLEGSRLGGQVLQRQVGQGLPIQYLGQSSSTGPWAAVVAALDRHLYSEATLGEAQAAARDCFTLFLSVAREAADQ